ncbi:MAG: hypothetical protein ACKV2Q_11075 [Planctomycetaceae bacterium]
MSFAALPQHWVNAAVVFAQQRLVRQYAEQSGQNREAIYRDAHRLNEELEVAKSAAQAQAEGVSLPVAQRLLKTLRQIELCRSVR